MYKRQTAKRARQLIAGDEALVIENGRKPLSIAIDELYHSKAVSYTHLIITIFHILRIFTANGSFP